MRGRKIWLKSSEDIELLDICSMTHELRTHLAIYERRHEIGLLELVKSIARVDEVFIAS